jgi:hypothetical protein
MRGGIVRIEVDGPLDELCSAIVITGLMGDGAEQVQRIHVVGLHREDLAVEPFGVRQSPSLVMLESERESLLDRDRGHGRKLGA